MWTEERLAADRLILTKKIYNWYYIKFIFRFFLLRKDESKVEEEAYAQAKEEKEEDEGTFQVDYLLHLSNALSVFYVDHELNVPRDVFRFLPDLSCGCLRSGLFTADPDILTNVTWSVNKY